MAGEAEVEDNVITTDRDDVDNSVREAIASLRGETQEAPAEPAEQSEQGEPEKAERVRGPDGKFIPKDAAPEKVEAAPEQKSATAESIAKPSEPQVSTPVAAAPVSWSPDAKAAWASLPPAIQNAVIKRETEASNGFRQYSEKVTAYEQALAPLVQASQRVGLPPAEGLKRLLDGQTFLEQQPEQAILWLASKNGIDLSQLASNPPAHQPARQVDPIASQVVPQISSLEQRLQQIEFGQNLSVTHQFAGSKPYYADVEEQLPDIIQEIKATQPHLGPLDILEKAYDRAVWLNPDVRAKVIAAEHAKTEAAKTTQIAQKATQASKAAVSVKGSSSASVAPKRPDTNGTVQDDVRDAIAMLRAG